MFSTFLRGEQTNRPPSSSYINIIVQEITHYMMNDEWLWPYVKQKQSLNLNRNPCDLLLRFAIISISLQMESNTRIQHLVKQLHLDGLTDSLII